MNNENPTAAVMMDEQPPTSRKARIVQPAEGEIIESFGNRARLILGCADTDGEFVLSEIETPAGWGPPLHVHQHEDELFIIQSGCYEFRIGDECLQAAPGTVIYGPRHVPHTFYVVSETPGRMLVLTRPGSFEGFLRRCAAEFATGAPNMANILALGSEHGVAFLPPQER